MKLNFTLLFLLTTLSIAAQDFVLQGKVTDYAQTPVSDAYVFNIRNSANCFSTSKGLFELRVQPSDTLIISHISFLRKVVTVYELLKNPVVILETDTLNIKPVNVTGNLQTAHDQAMKNINYQTFDALPRIGDNFSETERTATLMKTEKRELRTEASSVKIASFSPSAVFGKFAEKRAKRKIAKEYNSTRKLPEDEE
jgi:hypothetical protein